MQTPKKYFHDRIVLLFLTVNTFLALLCGVLVLLRLDNRVNGYIVQYRVNLGINAFKTGSVSELIAFIVFALTVLILHTVLSMKTYDIHRQFAVGILSLGTLLITLSIIISNALLVLH
jgi:hypothetical protein